MYWQDVSMYLFFGEEDVIQVGLGYDSSDNIKDVGCDLCSCISQAVESIIDGVLHHLVLYCDLKQRSKLFTIPVENHLTNSKCISCHRSHQ